MADVALRRAARLGYLAGLLENTEDGVVALDAEWLVTVWNTGAERVYGWTADEVLGRDTRDVIRLDMSDEERAEARRAVAEHGRWRGEAVAYRKDGTAVCVELIAVALRERGRITGYLGIHRDMTDRKQAEEALRAEQRRSETILESISDAFVALDRRWRCTYANDRALVRLSAWRGRPITRDEVMGRGLWELFPDMVGTEAEYGLRAAMGADEPVEFELHFAPTEEWLEARVFPSAGGLSIYCRNVTARRRAEQEMSRRAQQQALVAELGRRALASDDLQSLLDEAVDLVARTLDVELSCVAEIPPAGGAVILRAGAGWRDGFIGRRFERGSGDSQAGYTLLRGEPVIAEDQANDPRFRRSALAAEHGVASAASVMIESPTEPFGVLEALSTRRRSFSPSEVSFLQAVANVLAGAVERSGAQERLIEVREAERSRLARDLHDEALQDLTHALALAGGQPRAGRSADVPGDLNALLKRVGERLREAIYDLRLGGEQHTPFPDLLESLVGVHRAVAVGCEIELDTGRGIPTGPLGASGIEMLRILGEALTNARRHAGARRIRVSVWSSDGRLHAEVSDDGGGFDGGGLRSGGQGLMGMQERAALLHGRLDVVSAPASGTTIRLEVPLEQPPVRASDQARVLLVEDHNAVRQAIAAMFDREPDFTVVGQARTLAEARDLLQAVDVAVIDLGLPDGDGADLIADLRRASPGAHALVLSANLDRAGTARAIESGAAAALDKTADLEHVVEAVRRLRAGQNLLTSAEIAELLSFAKKRRDREHEDRQAIAGLTRRERQVLQALGEGLDSQAIAERFGMSLRTERNHVARILHKLGVHSQLQAVLFALRYGVIDDR